MQCKAKAETTGKRCKNPAGESGFCGVHDHESGTVRPAEMREDGTMHQAAFARYLGVTDERVRQYRETGIIELNDEGRIDVAQALEDLDTFGDTSKSNTKRSLYDHDIKPERADPTTRELKEKLKRAKLEHTRQRARAAKIEADELEKSLIRTDEVDDVRRRCASAFRERIQTIPDEVADELADTDDERTVYDSLRGALNEALHEVADDLEAQAAADNDDEDEAQGAPELWDAQPGDDLGKAHLRAKVECQYQRARLARLKADHKEGQFVAIDEAIPSLGDEARTARDRILNIPERTAGHLAGVRTPDAVRDTLADEFNVALDSLTY